MSDEPVARQVADLLVQELRPRRVVWFGSRAAGTGGPDSDYDFLVVLDTDLPLAERSFRAYRAVRRIPVPKDIVVVTPDEHARQGRWTSSVVYEAERTGKVLFEAADRP